MSDSWDTAGYIASSRYRASVCRFLDRQGPELPSRIAEHLDLAQPHVSRALSELRDREIVELLVPESQQKGRLYGLTDRGERALVRLQGEAVSVSVSFVDAAGFPHEPLVDFLREEYGSEFRLAVAREGDDTAAFAASEEVRERYDEESLEHLIAALRASDATLEDGLDDPATGECEYDVRGFERSLLLRLPAGEDAEVLVSLASDADVEVPAFVRDCRRRLRN